MNNTEEFLQGTFELNCPLIEIIPYSSDAKKTSLKGSGIITIKENGCFYLKVFIPDVLPISEVFESQNWDAGKIISDEYFYNIIAHDIKGEIWRAERFIPEKNSGLQGSMIIGKVPELHRTQKTDIAKNKHLVKMLFNESIKIPMNTAVTKEVRVGDSTRNSKTSMSLVRYVINKIEIEIEVDKEDNYTTLTAVSEDIELFDEIINRIFESFIFVTAYTRSWSMLSIRRNGEIITRIRAHENDGIKTRTQPPIAYQNIVPNRSVWQLFDSYFKYVSLDTEHKLHPLSVLLRSVLESGKASLDVEALTLSVSIESLLNENLINQYIVSKELENNLKKAKELINSCTTLDTNFKKRMHGMIGSMKKARAKDILFTLKDNGFLDKDLIDTYGNLRNKSAHGSQASGGDIQNYFNQTSAVLVLFYQLIFLIIGYTGEYTDYGTYNYPTKSFIGKLP